MAKSAVTLQEAIHAKAGEKLREDMQRFQKTLQTAFQEMGVRGFYLWHLRAEEGSAMQADATAQLARRLLEAASRNLSPCEELPELLAQRESKLTAEVLEAGKAITDLQWRVDQGEY